MLFFTLKYIIIIILYYLCYSYYIFKNVRLTLVKSLHHCQFRSFK